jgi:hypothetical protein
MLQHRAIIRWDPFSFTRTEAPVISKEWLSELILAGVGNHWGWTGIAFLGAGLIATTLWLLYRRLVVSGCHALLATGLVLVVGFASTMHWLARPHLVTHLLTVVFAWRLWDYDRDRVSSRQVLVPLTLLMVLWTNLHGAFFTGLVLIGIHVAGNGWDFLRAAPAERPRRKHKLAVLAGLALIGLLATCVNPNGWRLPALIVGCLRDPVLMGRVNEFVSPSFHSPMVRGFLLELLLLVVVLTVIRPRLTMTEILLLGTWGYFALHSVRNIPLFALIVTPILAGPLNTWLARVWPRLSSRFPYGSSNWEWAAAVVVATGSLLATSWLPTEPKADRFPVAAVRYVQTHTNAVAGRVFNQDTWGGYLLQTMPERKVWIDTRLEFYGKQLIGEYLATTSVATNWTVALDKHEVTWTLMPTDAPLNQILAIDPRWHRAYSDSVATIFTRQP